MARDLYVANTDIDWFRFFQSKDTVNEVNFWQPSAQHFKAIPEGGIFAFRLKSPINKIAGFGVLASAGEVTVKQAWEDLKEANGVASIDEFIARVRKYRSGDCNEYSRIGFKIIADPVFLADNDWLEQPTDWKPQIVTGKSYDGSSTIAAKVIAQLSRHQSGIRAFEADRRWFEGFSDSQKARYANAKDTKVRLGQGGFRTSVFGAYDGRCALTGTRQPEVLEAAHIMKFAEGGPHHVSNGVLLRKDLHALFDNGLLSFADNGMALVSKLLRNDFSEDGTYHFLQGGKLAWPEFGPRPSLEFLRWHRKHTFKDD